MSFVESQRAKLLFQWNRAFVAVNKKPAETGSKTNQIGIL